MAEFHQHPDGLVYVRTHNGTYCDTVANFEIDAGVDLPLLPEGADDRIYAPGKRHAIMSDGDVIEGGPMPWPLADDVIASIDRLLAAQAARLAPPPPTLDQAKAKVSNQIDRQFQQLAQAPIVFEVAGTEYQWHADAEAIQNIMGITLLIASGVPVPDPRPWTPRGSLTPVDISHAELIGLGAAIAARKDALFVVKKRKQQQLSELENVDDVLAYDVTAGWTA